MKTAVLQSVLLTARTWLVPAMCAMWLPLSGCSDDGSGDPGGGGDAAAVLDSGPISDAGAVDAEGAIDAIEQDAGPPTFRECGDDDAAFVRNAYLAVLGHRPRSSAEVQVYTDIMSQVRALADAGASVPDPQRVVVRALTEHERYVDRWTEQFMDALKVPRVEDQTMESCYNRSYRAVDDGSLAQFVRDNPATGGGDGLGLFSMLDVMRSALVLDDLSPVYRAHLFTLMSRPMIAGNVPFIQAELARRADFGQVFDAAYLNRDIVCLGCHNSEFSVTYHPDPEENRHFAMPGYFEKALYGQSGGIDPKRAHAPFRFADFSVTEFSGSPGQTQPWGWARRCGSFNPIGMPADPAGIDGRFGSLTGDRITVYDLEAALARGFDLLAQNGLEIVGAGDIEDPDTAFAYMVAAAIVERVWREVVGSPLTIANYFARNAEARDLLQELTDEFIANRFSLRELLIDIVTSPYFNRAPPEEACGDEAYNMPPVYDPWVVEDEDVTLRQNSAADGVAPLSARTLLRTAYAALGWQQPRFQDFPELPLEYNTCNAMTCQDMLDQCTTGDSCCVTHELVCADPPAAEEPTAADEHTFLREIGAFLKNAEHGFRGLDFQARLAWEDRFGQCAKLRPESDYIDVLTGFASLQNVTVRDVVVALKDRLIGEPFISDVAGPSGTSEAQAMEAFLGRPLDTHVLLVPDLQSDMRSLCGVLLASPQFMLSGVAARGGDIPQLTLSEASFYTICVDLASRGLADDLALLCEPDSLTVAPTMP